MLTLVPLTRRRAFAAALTPAGIILGYGVTLLVTASFGLVIATVLPAAQPVGDSG